MIKGLHHIAILCSNKENSLNFYCGGLGFKVRKEHIRPERNDELLMLEGYGIVLEIFISPNNPKRISNPEAYGLRHLALHADNIESLVNSLKLKGFKPENIRYDTFDGEKMVFVKDPDGLPIELHE